MLVENWLKTRWPYGFILEYKYKYLWYFELIVSSFSSLCRDGKSVVEESQRGAMYYNVWAMEPIESSASICPIFQEEEWWGTAFQTRGWGSRLVLSVPGACQAQGSSFSKVTCRIIDSNALRSHVLHKRISRSLSFYLGELRLAVVQGLWQWLTGIS